MLTCWFVRFIVRLYVTDTGGLQWWTVEWLHVTTVREVRADEYKTDIRVGQECIPVECVPPTCWPYPVLLGGGGGMQTPLLDADPPWRQTPSDVNPRSCDLWCMLGSQPPVVNRIQTGVKTLPCPRFRLRPVINNKRPKYYGIASHFV